MSSELQDHMIHIDSVDVKECNENVSICETISDSGVSNIDSSSTAYPQSSDSDTSPTKSSDSVGKANNLGATDNDIDSIPTSPVSVSLDTNDVTHNTSGNKEYLLINKNSTESSYDTTTKDIVNMSSENLHNTLDPDLFSNNHVDTIETLKKPSELNMELKNNTNILTSSTISLNEQIIPSINNNIDISKSAYSRSAENISNVEQNVNNGERNSSANEINAEEVLLQFHNKKNKVTTNHKIVEPSVNIDGRHRLPMELIPQDLGSIVKNVHGIFSTVSGSLKNAYNNTHRISIQKVPVKPMTKQTPNVMNYIFDGETVEEETENGNEKYNEIVDNTSNVIADTITEQVNNEHDIDNTKDKQNKQVETLERLLAELKKENASLKDLVKQHSDEKDQAVKESESKLEMMSRRVEQAEREKDAAVMRYASVECAGIEAKRTAEKAIAAERAALNEVELLNNKLKSAHSEKQRICQLYDDKCHELSNSEREVSKIREELRELEGRLKWTQSKLRMEMDAYKESAERAEKLSQKVSELEATKEAAATNAVDSVRAKQLEADLKESQAALILSRHEKQELDKRLLVTSQQLDACVRERDSASCALTAANAQVERLQTTTLRLEEEAAELAALRAQAALADTLTGQLARESERSARAEQALAEARALAETCARREAAALEHAAKLTASHVQRKNDEHAEKDKVQALSADNISLRERVTALEKEIEDLTAALTAETDRRNRENKVLARKVAELTEEVADANKKLEWEKGENGVLKKKHASAIKELNRELQRALKRCEQLEAKLPPPDSTSTRTGSVTSLSSGESVPQEERLQNGHSDVPDIQAKEPDRQALIERIVSLQRAAARRAERCEFLEEHSKQLTGELRTKSRLLRHLLCSMPAGAVGSQDRDANKKEMARLGGGAMAAVWGGDPTGLSPELSLQMIQRLQAVLEDALLNNITLKENMETLGAEISRLKEGQRPSDASKSN